VLLNPANILGPYDPNTWSRMFSLAQHGRLPVAPPGAAPFCHVREVVRALLRAVDRGGIGERYILAGTQATYREVFQIVHELLGRKAPPVAPGWLLLGLATARDWASRASAKEPEITPEMARVLSARYEARSSKAERELGFQSVPLRQMLEDTFEWLRAEHLV
jgi:nucleoside-diphosphate-sugar epimerase